MALPRWVPFSLDKLSLGPSAKSPLYPQGFTLFLYRGTPQKDEKRPPSVRFSALRQADVAEEANHRVLRLHPVGHAGAWRKAHI